MDQIWVLLRTTPLCGRARLTTVSMAFTDEDEAKEALEVCHRAAQYEEGVSVELQGVGLWQGIEKKAHKWVKEEGD